jgi:hypothetical protein
LKKTVNRPPYILNIGDTHHVVVDNEIFMTSHCVSGALLNLFAAYYVFYIEYSREVKLSLLFIQSKISTNGRDLKNFCFPISAMLNAQRFFRRLTDFSIDFNYF